LGNPVHFYVWYHASGDISALRAAVDDMMADVAARTGIVGRLLLRRDERRTWMEVYERVTDADQFERALADAVARHDLARVIEGGVRHVEAFVTPE
jgi:Domain of unknown function (DUF4936)